MSKQAPRPSLLEQMGGVAGLVHSALPTSHSWWPTLPSGLQGGIWFAVGVAMAITLWRLWREESIQPAISGLFGVSVADVVKKQTQRVLLADTVR